MTIRVQFRCGHEGQIPADAERPSCARCGAVGISRSYAPAPRFVGHASGPLVTKQDLGPATVKVGLQHG